MPPNQSKDTFDWFHFCRFLAWRRIEIIQLNDINDPKTGIDLQQLLDNREEELELLGEGRSWSVIDGRWNALNVAVKVPNCAFYEPNNKWRDIMTEIFYEIQVMSHYSLSRHPNIVKLIGLSFYERFSRLDDTSSSLVYPILVLEKADPKHPDLRCYVESCKHIPLFQVLSFIADMADGLTALHKFGVIHADIKAANVLVFQRENDLIAKISDFGGCGVDINEDAFRIYTADLFDDPPDGSRSMDFRTFGLVCRYLASHGRLREEEDDKDIGFTLMKIEELYEPSPGRDSLLHLLRQMMSGGDHLLSISEIRTKLLYGLKSIRLIVEEPRRNGWHTTVTLSPKVYLKRFRPCRDFANLGI
jgi:serine/threonine protein kinase